MARVAVVCASFDCQLPVPCFCFLTLHFPLCLSVGLCMAPFKTLDKQVAKVSLSYVVQFFLPTVCYRQSRASDDSVWVHDKAPGAPRAATQSSNPNASLSSKLMVSNLHYEITPRDLTVCLDAHLPHSCVMTFAPSGGNFWANWHARARAIHQGTKVRLPLPRVVVVEEKTLNLLAPPFRDSVMLTRLRFSLFFTLSLCSCF